VSPVRLSGRDAAFLYEERPGRPMHTVKVLELEGEGIDAPALRALLACRIPGLAPLRRHVVTVPGRIYHPVWVDAGLPDLEHHVGTARVAPPGGCEQLCRLVIELGAEPLDRGRPLWRLWVVQGLADERQAVILLLHHALGDAATSRCLLEGMFGATEIVNDGPPGGEAPPRRRQLVGEGVRDLVRLGGQAPALLRGLAEARTAVTEPMPRLPVTGSGGGRTCAFVSFSLDAVRGMADAAGLTVTEFVLAATADALRTLLLDREQLPPRSLVAAVPQLPAAAPPGRWGNHLVTLFIPLATDEPDPQVRRARIRSALRHAAAQQPAAARSEQWWELYPLRRLAYRAALRGGRGRERRVLHDLLVSSVNGGHTRHERRGISVVRVASLGALPLDGDCSLTAWSYAGSLVLGILATDATPLGAAELARRLRASFAEQGIAG
jgi:diacylglycerol O-acyltransferase